MIKAKLIVVGGDTKRTEVSLKKLPVTIGRAKEASITLPHSLVSRKHCELFEKNDKLFVRDLNSLNGTYLNNERITETHSILPGQLLTLGNVTFRASYSLDSENETTPKAVPNGSQQPNANTNNQNKPVKKQDDKDTDHGLEQDQASDFATEQVIIKVGENPANESVSIQHLNQLPEPAPHASFAGQIDVGEMGTVQANPSSVNIDVGEYLPQDDDPSQSSLNEFFRKMPR